MSKKKSNQDLPDKIDWESFEARIRYGLGHDVVYELIKLYNDPDTSIAQKIKINEIILSYTHAKMKPLANQVDTEVIEVNIVSGSDERAGEIRQRIKERLETKDEDEF